ncbi:unnamed protein product [Effrenium voratum]|nr:unnamed protein product [Effrenium voratum]
MEVILARVAVGHCAPKAPLKEQKQLLRPEHREPPPGFHSCTSDTAPGREVIVFPGSPGTPAYPAYVGHRELARLRAKTGSTARDDDGSKNCSVWA